MLAPSPGVAQKVETNYWAQIPFLCSTSSVEQLSQHLNVPSLLPIRRFHALCSMFINNVYVGSSLTNFASAARPENDWTDMAEIEPIPLLPVKGERPDFSITFTNFLANWGLSTSKIENLHRPRIFVGFVEPTKNITREFGISVFKGHTSLHVSHYWFYTDWDEKWVVFTRDKRGDKLVVCADGRIYHKWRPTPHIESQ